MRNLEVCFVPGSLTENRLKEKTAVVVDVLRASTSVCTAIHNLCRQVIPVAEPERAFQLREELGSEGVLLCGERAGNKIEGFDLGNSPSEYGRKTVAEKTLIFCSTNGSGAIVKCRNAPETLIGGFVNATALVRYVNTGDRDLLILCSGREGNFALEDTLAAGMLAALLQEQSDWNLANDAAKAARLLYNNYAPRLEEAVRDCDHGRYLASLGFGDDIALALAVDSIGVVPVLQEGKLVPA
ncbi:MAG: 2-phosphosulfolactate phosphatase [bacterium]